LTYDGEGFVRIPNPEAKSEFIEATTHLLELNENSLSQGGN